MTDGLIALVAVARQWRRVGRLVNWKGRSRLLSLGLVNEVSVGARCGERAAMGRRAIALVILVAPGAASTSGAQAQKPPPGTLDAAWPMSGRVSSAIIRSFAFHSESATKFQLYCGLSSSLVKPTGMLLHIELSFGPASSSSTRVRGSSVSRLTSTQPAEPAPTMI
jgi:hypothetical protein